MKITITGGRQMTPYRLTELVLRSIQEVTISEMRVGAANGMHVCQRYETPATGELKWADVYIFRTGDQSMSVDVCEFPDQAALRRLYYPKGDEDECEACPARTAPDGMSDATATAPNT